MTCKNKKYLLFILAVILIFPVGVSGQQKGDRPNVVIILADDMGYADLGCYGASEIKTPNIDKIAQEGVRFTDFYAPACVCSPTRSSLLTGCYPKRLGLNVGVIELFKAQGYATACIGKWHLGSLPQVSPLKQGFDYYYGMPGPNHGRSDLYRNDTLLKKNKDVDYDGITIRYTEEAVSFIKKNKENPFLLYLAQNAIHIPLFASARFRRHTGESGLYRDMVEELDWSSGEVIKALSEAGVLENTIVIFTSDNGPSGVAAPPLHGGKGSSWEAGFRVPFIVRWPQVIPANTVCRETATMMDLLPTLAPLAGAKVPSDRKIDGHNILPLLTKKKARSPYKFFYYYGRDGNLAAIRQGNWKLHLLEPSEKWAGKQPVKEALLDTRPSAPLPWLYDLSSDIGETKNVASGHTKIVRRLRSKALEFDKKLTAEVRPSYTAKSK
ncbi:MAG: sulfatase family protein [Daejeonella sp.]